MAKTTKLEKLQAVHATLVKLSEQASKLYDSLDGSPRDEALVRLQNSVSNLLDEIEGDTWRTAKKIQDLEFDVNRTADFEGGY